MLKVLKSINIVSMTLLPSLYICLTLSWQAPTSLAAEAPLTPMIALQFSRAYLATGLPETNFITNRTSEWVDGYLTHSTQTLSGSLDIALAPAQDKALIGLIFRSSVEGETRTHVYGPRIPKFVSFNTHTSSTTTKWFSWTLNGLQEIYPATTQAKTSVYNLDSQRILFRGIALNQLQQKIPRIQALANHQAITQSNQIMDDDGKDQIMALENVFRRGTMRFYIENHNIPGRPYIQSTVDYIFFQSFISDWDFYERQLDIFGKQSIYLPPFQHQEPDVGMRISERFADDFFREHLPDMPQSVFDLERHLANLGLRAYFDHHIPRMQELDHITVKLDPALPVAFRFARNTIKLSLRITAIDDQEAGEVHGEYQLTEEDGELVALRNTELSGELEKFDAKGILVIKRLLPPKLTLDALVGKSTLAFFAKFLDLSEYRTEHGWLVIGWRIQ